MSIPKDGPQPPRGPFGAPGHDVIVTSNGQRFQIESITGALWAGYIVGEQQDYPYRMVQAYFQVPAPSCAKGGTASCPIRPCPSSCGDNTAEVIAERPQDQNSMEEPFAPFGLASYWGTWIQNSGSQQGALTNWNPIETTAITDGLLAPTLAYPSKPPQPDNAGDKGQEFWVYQNDSQGNPIPQTPFLAPGPGAPAGMHYPRPPGPPPPRPTTAPSPPAPLSCPTVTFPPDARLSLASSVTAVGAGCGTAAAVALAAADDANGAPFDAHGFHCVVTSRSMNRAGTAFTFRCTSGLSTVTFTAAPT